MTETRDLDAAGGPPPARRPNYTGAIYGSLLAASVVVAISNGGGDSHYVSPLLLAVWLIAIGLVFWLAHVYLRLVGDRIDDASLNWWEIRRAARHEWPIFRAALPPAAAALIFGLLGAGNVASGWAALIVAIVEQVRWATFVALRMGASRPLVLVTALVNLMLGLLIVMLNAVLYH